MAVLRDSSPLGNHRARLAEYLRAITFSTATVAGRIIAERAAAGCARDAVRPNLVLWACDCLGGDLADALPVAAAFDLFDRFLALHEELTQDSPTVARWGLGQSLNAGDALYALAFRTLAADVTNPARRLETARLVGEAILAAIEAPDETTRSTILNRAALRAGAVIAGAPDAVLAAAELERNLPHEANNASR